MHAKPDLRVFLEWKIYRPDSVIATVIRLENMEPHFKHILDTVEPLDDSIYGPRYRCAVTLKDGTHLPCVVLQSKQKVVEQAKRRIRQEINGDGPTGGDDPYGQIITTFVAQNNRINDYDVAAAEESKFAPPVELLRRIHGETTMGWTGWVFEMTDGKKFAYGSSFTMEFFQLPDGYLFKDVAEVHNHSFLDSSGKLAKLEQGIYLPESYDIDNVLRERMYFSCAIAVG